MNTIFNDRRTSDRGNPRLSRRRFPRMETILDAIYESPYQTLISGFADLNLRGMRLVTATPDPVGTPVFLRLKLPDPAIPELDLKGEVVWSRFNRFKDNQCGMGIRFTEMSGEVRKRIAAYVLSHGGLSALPGLAEQFRSRN